MQKLLILFVHVTAYLAYGAQLGYRQDGKYMIGAILPLTKEGSDGKCSGQMNPEGVAVAEAIVLGIDNINKRTDAFKDLVKSTPIGYDIRDNCGKVDETVYIALNMTAEKIKYDRGESLKQPVSVVISEFDLKAFRSLPLLNSQGISQISYSKNNARLKNDGTASEDSIKQLISMYPGSNKKILAVVDIVKKFQFGYVHAVATKNVEGTKSMKLLSSRLSAEGICKSEDLFVSTVADIDKVLSKVAENPKIRVVVVHLSKELEKGLYEEASKRNMTDLIMISTQNWDTELDSLNQYSDVLEGMIYLQYQRTDTYVEDKFRSRSSPYLNKPWLKRFFLDIGGNATCFKNSVSSACAEKEKDVVDQLVNYEAVAVYAFEATYAIAYALQKSKTDKTSLVDAAKGMKVYIPYMSSKNIIIGKHLSTEISKFHVQNVQKKSDGVIKKESVGNWNEDPNIGGAPLYTLMNKNILWKDGKKEIPLSVCSDSCPPGNERKFSNPGRKCCWTCSKCPNDTASNISDSDKCLPCSEGYVVKPNQSGCEKYKLLYFDWYGPVGIVIIILIIISIVLIIFALVVFSNNNMHELVLNANYNSLSIFLLALIIMVISPIPLLIQPTESSCFAYIILVNVAISIVIGILISRSAYINNFFDDNGELVKGNLGPFPRPLIVTLVVILQIIVNIVAYNMETILVMHNKTEKWDVRYHECSSWASITFWAGFTFNVVASVVGNSLSCSSTKMDDDAAELKHVLQCHLVFYIVAIIELCVFFRSNDHHLAGGQGVCCILYALGFFICYIGPKLFIILFRSKGNKAIEVDPEDDEEGSLMTTAVHASAGFKHHGIVQMKVRDED